MLLDSVFFQGIFSIPGALVAGFVIGTFLGSGSINLYSSLRLKLVLQQTRGQDIPRSVARSMTVSLCLSSILLAFGVLPFFGLLAGNESVTGMILNWWAVIFVATCGLVTLSVYITVFMARKRREQSRRLEGRGMEGEEQRARSRPLPVPKEAREEEQGPMER